MVKNQMSDLGQKLQLTLDYLYSFVDYSLTRQLRYSPEKFNLDRMRELLRLMGEPHKDYPVVHIAGTKGKGSTAAMIASILVAAGYKTGLYTSPHLQDFTERIQVDGTPITHSRLVDLVEKLKPLIAQVPEITTFEITTALAFQEFHDSQVDVAVIEVGLGGRLDATNVVDPLVSVITSLSFDHMNVLGDSIAQIAAEKGGIIKAGKPVVLSPQWKEAREVIERIATERNAPLTVIGQDYFYGEHSRSLDGQTFFLWSNQEQELVNEYISSGGRTEWEPEHFTIPLLGMHQVENAATAYATIQVMRQNGFRIERDAIAAGFRAANWPGRFEILKRNPLIIIDSAHNQDSALRLRLAMDDYLNGKPIILLFGSSEDKDVRGMFNHLLPRVRSLVATRSTHPRAMEPELLVELANQFGKHAVETQSVEEGLAEAIRLAGRDSVIMVTGSIFVAAAVRDLLVDLTKNHT
jgi:dihydrofolate synthase/folylpolyglutamate synthase